MQRYAPLSGHTAQRTHRSADTPLPKNATQGFMHAAEHTAQRTHRLSRSCCVQQQPFTTMSLCVPPCLVQIQIGSDATACLIYRQSKAARAVWKINTSSLNVRRIGSSGSRLSKLLHRSVAHVGQDLGQVDDRRCLALHHGIELLHLLHRQADVFQDLALRSGLGVLLGDLR